MTQHETWIRCWHCGGSFPLSLTDKQEQTLIRRIDGDKVECSDCIRHDRGIGRVFIEKGKNVFNLGKLYQCGHGHISIISPFVGDNLNIQFGSKSDQFFNIRGSLDELPKLLDTKEITCHHSHGDILCDSKLLPVDDSVLSYPVSPGIKTRTRVGDLWDRYKAEPVRNGHYTDDGYKSSRSQEANKKRLQKTRDRNIPLSKIPGKKIYKPSK